MERKLKVHVLFDHLADQRPFGSSYIRLLRPLSHPANEDALELSWGVSYESADVLIVERAWKSGITVQEAEHLIRQARSDGAKIIHTIDDNLLDLRIEGPILWKAPIENLAEYPMVIRFFAREADGIIVSTSRLKERMARFNNLVVVVPNALDERLFEVPTSGESFAAPNGRRKVIGYMGTFTHDSDIMMVTQALREVLRKYRGSVEFEFAGGFADSTVIKAFDGLPVRVLKIGANDEYPDFIRWMMSNIHWDLAIAPLEDNVFTRCKSDMKFLDYSAMGIAGIYSHVAPYESTVKHLETGYLASNDTDSWVEGLELMVADDSFRKSVAARAQEYVLSNRMLKQCARNWQDAIFSIANQKNP
jgi:glycosyltransferase involved in cell wall biosynthesis